MGAENLQVNQIHWIGRHVQMRKYHAEWALSRKTIVWLLNGKMACQPVSDALNL